MMNSIAATRSRKALTVKVALAALLTACIAMVIGANHAKAAQGDPFAAEFNYAGLNVDVTLAQVDELVLDGTGDSLQVSGTYTDNAGNFTLPKETGLTFPPIAIGLTEDVDLDASISLESDGSGNYNATTGVMSMEVPIALTIGVSDMSALPIPGLGTGPLSCKFAPINISLSTEKGWPHDGYAFADPATVENGALAGAWRSKPGATMIEGDQSMCDLIAGFLQPVGGLWLANSTTPLSGMPDASENKPPEANCEELGKVGTFPECEDPVCPEGQVGEYPNCEEPEVPLTEGKLGSLTITKKVTVKAGKKAKVKISIKNTGQKTLSTKVTLKSSNKQVKAPKTVSFSVAGGKTVTKTVTVSTTKKAKGKATITAKAGVKTAKSSVTVKAAKKKKKK